MTRLLVVLALAAYAAAIYALHAWTGGWVLGLEDDTRLAAVAVAALAIPLFLAALVRFNVARWSFGRVALVTVMITNASAAALLIAPTPPDLAPAAVTPAPTPAAKIEAPPPPAERPPPVAVAPAPEPIAEAPPAHDTFYRYVVDGEVRIASRLDDVPLPYREQAEVSRMARHVALPERPAAPSPAVDGIVARINVYRRAAGLAGVVADPAKNAGAQAHAEYIQTNAEDPRALGLGLHDESPTRPGYSEAGAFAGRHGVIAVQDGTPRDAVELWMATFFHRIPLVHPRLERVGVGVAERGERRVFVVEVAAEGQQTDFVAVPPDEAVDVPIAFSGDELPNPIPRDDDGEAGYPITVTFPPNVRVEKADAELVDVATGGVVAAWVSTPEHPADERAQQNTVCLMAKDPLRPLTRYTFTLDAVVDGQPHETTIRFTTRGS